MESIDAEFRERYVRLVERWTEVLGPPRFFGPWQAAGFSQGQAAAELTCWDGPEGRLQIELSDRGREFPFLIRVACYPVPAAEHPAA